jgi:hypothetical protein
MKKDQLLLLVFFFLAHTLCARIGLEHIEMFTDQYSVISQPVLLPNYYLVDVNRLNISPQGNQIIRSNWGGNFSSYSVTGARGTQGRDFLRNEVDGQYYIIPFFSPRGGYAALHSALGYNDFDTNGRMEILDVKTQSLVFSVDTTLRGFVGTNFTGMDWPTTFDFSPNESLLAYTKTGKDLVVYDLVQKKTLTTIALNEPYYVTAIAFHPNGSLI